MVVCLLFRTSLSLFLYCPPIRLDDDDDEDDDGSPAGRQAGRQGRQAGRPKQKREKAVSRREGMAGESAI